MYHRTREFITSRFRALSLRIKCFNLPPVATHLACFILGTLLFEPDTSGRVPPGILVPWTPQRIEGGIERTKDYSVVSKTKHCLLLDVPVRVWPAEEKKLYAVLPKTKDIGAAVAALHKIETVLVVQTAQSLPHCEISNAIVYP